LDGINGIFYEEEELPEISSHGKVVAMKSRYWVPLLVAVVVLGLGLWIAFVYDPVLDRKIPVPAQTWGPRYLDQLEAIAPIVGKKVIFPAGLVDYASREKLGMPGFPVYIFRNSRENYFYTVRDYLNERRALVGLKSRYDATQDAIIFDFAWHRPVSRSAPELVDEIGKLSPAPEKSLQWKNGQLELDPWRKAVDELMSEPGNFPHAWKIRLQGCCSYCGSTNDSVVFDDNVYSHILKDADGKDHLLIFNSHRPLTTKSGHGSFVCYLFSADGTWEDGGIFAMGGPYCPPTVRFEPEKNRAVIEIDFEPLKITDSATGKVTTLASALHVGDALQYSLEVKQGKLADSIWTNVSPMPSPLDETFGVTPLRHLGD